MIDYTKVFTSTSKTFDQGLRDYMLKVYQYLMWALLITGVSGYLTLSFEPLTNLVFNITPRGITGYTGIGWITSLAPIGIAFYYFANFGKLTLEQSRIMLWIYSGLTGISLSSLGFLYTGVSIVRTFFICAASFAAMSAYGHSTNKDLSDMGTFMRMGLCGILVASIINIFLLSPAIYFVTSIIAVVVFLGLIAWDTQKLKQIYYSAGNDKLAQQFAIMGAFILYLDFINLFLYLIRFIGVSKRDQ